VEDVPDGGRLAVRAGGRDIVVFNLSGDFFAVLDRCPHEGAKLSCGVKVGLLESAGRGDVRYSRPGEFLRCPWHGWEFDIRTGKSYTDPNKIRARPVSVSVADGRDLVEGPYKLELYQVSVAGSYLVVSL
jgi:3-phenylpropionate/trans-cinnamate dioxygenase ferredoxin subunit